MTSTLGPARMLAQAAADASSLDEALAAGTRLLRDALGLEALHAILVCPGRTLNAFSGNGALQANSIFSSAHGTMNLELEMCGAPQCDPEPLALVLLLALQERVSSENLDVDALTGVLNRRGFERGLRDCWDAACQTGDPLAVAILDVDFFKLYNDRYGHTAGDTVLRRVARAASAALQRGEDRFARYGGEEFVVLLGGTNQADAVKAAERMRAAVSALGIPHASGKGGRVTVSVGVAVAKSGDVSEPMQIVERADSQLYRSKADGRDRVSAEGYGGEQGATEALPQPYSVLVGREAEVQRVRDALEVHGVVTITGTAGVGKTRLALAVAAEKSRVFSSVAFIDVWAGIDAADVLARIDDLEDSARALVVLNGCEQAADVSRAVMQATKGKNVSVLATSRVPLGVPDEQVVRMLPLDESASRALLEDRARMNGVLVQCDEKLTGNLLRRLGGIPLAIELAASRLRSASVAELLRETAFENKIEDTGRATLQSLLQAAIASLTEEEAAALAAAAVFAANFSSADASAVVPLDGIDARATDALLRTLHERSLIDAASHDGVTRWSTIAPVREAVSDHSRTRGLRVRAVAAHLRWCAERFNAMESRQGRVENRTFVLAIAAVEKEVDVALERALRDPALLDEGAQLCISASRFWFAGGRFAENQRWGEAYLDALTDDNLRLRLTVALARSAYAQGHTDRMETYARQAYELSAGDDRVRAQVLNYLGIASKTRGEIDVAEAAFRRSGELNASIGNVRGEAIAIAALGSIAMDVHVDFHAAIPEFRKAVAMFREIDDDLNALLIISNLVEALACAGYLGDALLLSERALREVRWFDNAATLLVVLCACVTANELGGDASGVREAVVEALSLPPRLDESSYNKLFDVAARYFIMTGQYGLAAMLMFASERAQVEQSEAISPVDRYHRTRQLNRLREHLSDLELHECAERARTQAGSAILQIARRALLP
ncbi:MAG TPA: diguanylate cyclase [Candidatus Baltobacteraceae bacterium]